MLHTRERGSFETACVVYVNQDTLQIIILEERDQAIPDCWTPVETNVPANEMRARYKALGYTEINNSGAENYLKEERNVESVY